MHAVKVFAFACMAKLALDRVDPEVEIAILKIAINMRGPIG